MNENDGSGFLPHECVFRKLASERLDRVTELAAENGELKHQLDGVVQENEALRAELATSREDTRRAERDWTKALAERDEARTQRDAYRVRLSDYESLFSLECCGQSASCILSHAAKTAEVIRTTREALSTLEQAARALIQIVDYGSWEDCGMDYTREELCEASVTLERALNEVSK